MYRQLSRFVTIHSLRANIEWKSPFLKLGGSFWPRISRRRGHLPPTISAHMDRPVNALQPCRWQFSHKQTLQHTFFQRCLVFYTETTKLSPLRPPWGLRGNVGCSSYACWKALTELLLVIIELFLLAPTVEPLWANIEWKSPFLKLGGSVRPKISGRRGRPPPTILCVRKTTW